MLTAMKKLTFLLMPVMPGFDAWAVHGFIVMNADSDEQPKALSKESLVGLLAVQSNDLFDGVFVPYKHVAFVVKKFKALSITQDIRPLDRGGMLMSFSITDSDFEKIKSHIVSESE